MKFQQIRGASAIITYAGKRFLIDPFLADKGSVPPVPSPHNNLPNPLVELPLPIGQIVDVDAVIVTHMHHFDHFDEAARNALPKDIPMFAQNKKEADDMRHMGFTDVTALADEGLSFADLTLFRTKAAHGQGPTAEQNYKAFGIPADASGVVFKAPGEETLYLAGDTLWYDGVREAIAKHKPKVIVINAAEAAFADETRILMGTDGLQEVLKAAPQATVIATHMDAVNHARLTRQDLWKFLSEKGLTERVRIPEDGESVIL